MAETFFTVQFWKSSSQVDLTSKPCMYTLHEIQFIYIYTALSSSNSKELRKKCLLNRTAKFTLSSTLPEFHSSILFLVHNGILVQGLLSSKCFAF